MEPRNRFEGWIPPAYVDWRAGTKTLFLFPIDCLKISAQGWLLEYPSVWPVFKSLLSLAHLKHTVLYCSAAQGGRLTGFPASRRRPWPPPGRCRRWPVAAPDWVVVQSACMECRHCHRVVAQANRVVRCIVRHTEAPYHKIIKRKNGK